MNDYLITIVDRTLYVYNQTTIIQQITLNSSSSYCTGVRLNDHLYVGAETTVYVYKLTTSTKKIITNRDKIPPGEWNDVHKLLTHFSVSNISNVL